MKMRNIKTIIGREYLTRVKKKSFLLTTFLVPILFAALCILPSVIMFMAKDTGKTVAVVDQSGIVMPYLVDTDAVDYESLQYFERVLRSSGIIDALEKAGIKQGDTVSVYDIEFEFVM